MLTVKDIQNRVYSGKSCIGFDYVLQMEDANDIEFHFRRSLENALVWQIQVVIDRATMECNDDVYRLAYVLPKEGIPLEMILAIGLRYIQLIVKEEVQKKSNIDFELGDRLAGMLHE